MIYELVMRHRSGQWVKKKKVTAPNQITLTLVDVGEIKLRRALKEDFSNKFVQHVF